MSSKHLTIREAYTYISYRCMIRRCYEEGHRMFPFYGGKGIKVHTTWLGKGGFEQFLKDMGRRRKNTTIDRKDGTKGYLPDNCKWSTDKQQNRNRHWKNVKLNLKDVV